MQRIKRVLMNPVFILAVLYLVFPADIIPDATPGVGVIDDLIPVVLSLILEDYLGQRAGENKVDDIVD